MAAIGSAVGEVVKQDFPQVKAAIKVRRYRDKVIQKTDSDIRHYETIHFVDSNVFQVFTLPMMEGNPQTALVDPNSIVISERMALKYFGRSDVMGSLIEFPEDTLQFEVTGIIRDIPANTHLQMDLLIPYHLLGLTGVYLDTWWSFNTHTYLLLAKNSDPVAFEEQVKRISARHIADQEEGSGYRQEYFLQSIPDIHLHSKLRGEISTNSDARYVYIFSIIGLFILLLACVNFMNLSTARSILRATEIGLRKVVGASRKQLMLQLLGESLLLTLISMFISLFIVYLSLPVLNDLTGKELSFSLFNQLFLTAITIGTTIFVGIASGVYPAFFLSAFKSVETLKGTFSGGNRGNLLRKGLVVFQFAISTILIACTLIIYKQLQHMQNAELGFAKDQVIYIPTRGGVGYSGKICFTQGRARKIAGCKSCLCFFPGTRP